MKHLHLDPGATLIAEGDKSDSMYIVEAGTFKVLKKKYDQQVQVGKIETGQLVGELSFLDGEPRSASVVAVTAATVIEIPRDKFDTLMVTLPPWMKSLHATLVNRIRNLNELLVRI